MATKANLLKTVTFGTIKAQVNPKPAKQGGDYAAVRNWPYEKKFLPSVTRDALSKGIPVSFLKRHDAALRAMYKGTNEDGQKVPGLIVDATVRVLVAEYAKASKPVKAKASKPATEPVAEPVAEPAADVAA
jgi:hypothetical protein